MPFVEHKAGRDFNTFETAQAPERAGPGLWDTFEAAFKMENTVANVADLVSRPVFAPQEGFQVRPAIQQYDTENRTNMFEQYGDAFLGVQSQDEMLYTVQRLKKEEENRDTLGRAGWLGVVAGITAGLVSPETFIPLVGAQKGWKAVRAAAAIGAATGTGQELILGANQDTRTGTEMAFGIGANTALAGLLGGVVGVMRAGERAVYEAEIEHVARRPSGVGADVVQTQSAGNIETGAQTLAKINDATGVFTNPVTQTINQTEFPTWRVMMQQLSDSGLRMELNKEGVATSLGGTAENRITPYMGMLGRNIEEVDASYARYFFDDNVPSFAPNVRATLGGTFNSAGKLSRAQFEDEVSRAIWNGYEHANPEVVAAAKATAKNVYEPILKEAQGVGLLPDDIEVVGDKAYATRLYNVEAIQTRTAEFVDALAKNAEKNLTARFTEGLNKFKTKQTRAMELADDLERPVDEVQDMVTKFRDELKAAEETLPPDVSALEEAIKDKRAQAKAMLQGPQSIQTETARKQLLKDAREMERAGKDVLTGPRTIRTDLKRRLKNLTQSRAAVDVRLSRKLDLMDASEDASLNSLRKLINKAQTTLQKLDRVSDAKLDAEVSKIKDQFEATARIYDKGEERLVKLKGDEDLLRLGVAEDIQTTRAMRLDDIVARLDDAENLDRVEIRGLIEDGLNETLGKVNELNLRRGMRQQKLLDQAKKLDPKIATERVRKVREDIPKAEGNFARQWEELGAEGVDPSGGVASFKDIARRSAEEVKDTIVGTYMRLPYSEVLAKERGSELARTLDIPSAEIDGFLEKNISKLTKSYVRTMGPDIEIARKFGSLDWREIIKPAVDELNLKIQEIDGREMKGTPEQVKAKKEKMTRKLNEDFDTNKKNFEAVINRLRGTRGLPADPDGFAYRASRTIMNLNVLRMMGMVTISSFPDLARPVMRYGLTRTFRDGFGPLINNLKTFKLNAREAKLAGAANEITTHTRAMAVRDIADELQRGSKFEKGVEWATNRIGLVAMFDYWTQGMKTLSSSVANAKLMDSLAKVNTGEGTLSPKEAVRYLAENGIDGNLANDIWREVIDNGGGGKVDGTWWPNTESWKKQELVNVYRQALAREVNTTIIQPGVERPLLSDANVLGRMLYQFKSFGLSSMPKLAMAGLQQRDAAMLSGSLASLGLGALSYYTWAVATGGKAYQDMLDADIGKWADEAISRAGLVATVGEIQRVGQNIPLVSNYASFSGKKQTRRPGDNLVESLLGPSFDFGQNALGVIGGLHDPTQATLNQFVRLLPYQNTLFLREGIEAVQNAVGAKLPERRQ